MEDACSDIEQLLQGYVNENGDAAHERDQACYQKRTEKFSLAVTQLNHNLSAVSATFEAKSKDDAGLKALHDHWIERAQLEVRPLANNDTHLRHRCSCAFAAVAFRSRSALCDWLISADFT